MPKRARLLGTLVVCGLITAACGASGAASTPSPTQLKSTPVQAALSWFHAIDHKDKAQAIADFKPSAASMMNWGNGNTSTWPTFTSIHCKRLSENASAASVYCTFSESRAPSDGNPTNFWTLAFQRGPGGGWLIDNYGQG